MCWWGWSIQVAAIWVNVIYHLLAMRKVKVQPYFSFYMACLRIEQQAQAGGGNHPWWNGALCWSQFRLTGRRSATILLVTPTRPKSFPVIQSRPNFFLLTQEIHSIRWGLSHYECWKKQPFEQEWKERYRKETVAIALYIFFLSK